ADGCWNCVVSPAPILKLCQLIAARGLCCWIVKVPGAVVAIVAWPPTTVPPSGFAAAGPPVSSASAATAAPANAPRDGRAPAVLCLLFSTFSCRAFDLCLPQDA